MPPNYGGRPLVPLDVFMQVRDELVRRIGQTNAAKRVGVASESLANHRLRTRQFVTRELHERASAVLAEARAAGEDGWSTREARIAAVAPYRLLGGYWSGEVRKGRQWDRQTRRWIPKPVDETKQELAMDLSYTDSDATRRCAEKGIPLADFECEHGRLSGDKTIACGCWPDEEVTMRLTA